MKKLLFVASRFPYPLIQGDRVRAYHQLRLLSRRFSITLLAPGHPDADRQGLDALAPWCSRIELVPRSTLKTIGRLLIAPLSHLPFQTLYTFDGAFHSRLNHLLSEDQFDLVHVQLVRMAPIASGQGNLPRVLDLVDALSLNMMRRSRQEHPPLSWLIWLEAKRVQRYERVLSRRYDRLVVASALDQAYMNLENVYVVPNGVDLEKFPFTEDERERATIVFTGRMAYYPNADAAVFFAREILPRIRAQMPEARFIVVGADPPQRVRQLARIPGVEVTGYVPHLHTYLARATVAACPLRAGSGMQFKVLEAMASGTPVVATLGALGGIEAQDGVHLLVAESAEALAAQVVRLLAEPALRRYLAYNARRLVEQRYTWERSVQLLEAVYEAAIQSHRTK